MGKVYLIKSSNESEILYKIGYTKSDPEKRKKQLETGNPNRLEILEVFETKFNTKLESNLHRKFKSKKVIQDATIFQDKKVKNEWFRLDSYDVENFIKFCESIEENYTFLLENNSYFKKNF